MELKGGKSRRALREGNSNCKLFIEEVSSLTDHFYLISSLIPLGVHVNLRVPSTQEQSRGKLPNPLIIGIGKCLGYSML